MSINANTQVLCVNDIEVQVVRKPIKNLHLGVYPPHGRVRVAAPLAVSDEAVRLAVIGKLGWIKQHQARFQSQPRQSAREMVNGESHYFLGRRYRLHVVVAAGPQSVHVRHAVLEMRVRQGADEGACHRLLQRWYRQHLHELAAPLLVQWQVRIGVQATAWGIKQMKTRWGGCNPAAGRIWLNLELAKKPAQCLEYILVHELIHLIERHHNERFVALMDEHLPHWRAVRDVLNAAPLGHSSWAY